MKHTIAWNEEKVAKLFANQPPSTPASDITPLAPNTSTIFPVSAPTITPFDGQPSNLRAFYSQLVNQINGSEYQFLIEIAKFQFAYTCLGPGALIEMRS